MYSKKQCHVISPQLRRLYTPNGVGNVKKVKTNIVREYIFRDLSEHKTALTIHGYHLELKGIILEINRETLLIEIKNDDNIPLKKGDILIPHTFEDACRRS